jgi:hypothetical protein
MNFRKIVFGIIIIFISLGIVLLVLNFEKIKNYIVLKEKNDFVIDVQNTMNVASNYFLRILDPKINKNEPVTGQVNVDELKEKGYLKQNIDINGKIYISVLGNNTNYIVVLSNDKYFFKGNYDEFKLESIELKN